MSNVYLEPGCYLPHKKPMVLIDKVVEVTDNSAICQSYVNESSSLAPFLEGKELPFFYIIELISQAIGVWSGFKSKQNNVALPPLGMVIGCRGLKCTVDKFAYNSTLDIKINKIMLITTPKVVTFLLIKYKVLSLELNLVLKKQISLTKILIKI